MNPEKISSEKKAGRSSRILSATWTLNPASAAGSSEYKGQTYYFCSPGCVKRFNADPEKYLAPAAAAQLPKAKWCRSAESRQCPPLLRQ